MKPHVLEQAKERLEIAESHFATLKAARDYKEFRIAWTQFLLALNSVFSKLEQGVKGCSKSDPWFGQIKGQRRKDQLLQYLHQARNADEHGIRPVSELKSGGFSIGKGGESVHIVSMKDGVVTLGQNPDGSFPTVEVYPSRAILAEVFDDLHKDSFPPPREHLGKPLEDNLPVTVAVLGIAFVRKTLEEAARLPQH